MCGPLCIFGSARHDDNDRVQQPRSTAAARCWSVPLSLAVPSCDAVQTCRPMSLFSCSWGETFRREILPGETVRSKERHRYALFKFLVSRNFKVIVYVLTTPLLVGTTPLLLLTTVRCCLIDISFQQVSARVLKTSKLKQSKELLRLIQRSEYIHSQRQTSVVQLFGVASPPGNNSQP